MTDTPTPRQRQVLAWVAHQQAAQGWPPSMSEMCAHFGWRSKAAAWLHLDALEKKGLVRREHRQARAVTVTPAGQRALEEEG